MMKEDNNGDDYDCERRRRGPMWKLEVTIDLNFLLLTTTTIDLSFLMLKATSQKATNNPMLLPIDDVLCWLPHPHCQSLKSAPTTSTISYQASKFGLLPDRPPSPLPTSRSAQPPTQHRRLSLSSIVVVPFLRLPSFVIISIARTHTYITYILTIFYFLTFFTHMHARPTQFFFKMPKATDLRLNYLMDFFYLFFLNRPFPVGTL